MSRTKHYIDSQNDGLYPYIWTPIELAEIRQQHINMEWQKEVQTGNEPTSK